VTKAIVQISWLLEKTVDGSEVTFSLSPFVSQMVGLRPIIPIETAATLTYHPRTSASGSPDRELSFSGDLSGESSRTDAD
jgi:hypothetical protein